MTAMPTEIEKRKNELIPVRETAKPVATLPLGQGMIPRTFEDAWRMAEAFAGSGMVPKDMAGKPKTVLAAIVLGAEIGLPPMSACQNIAVINGRPTLWGDAMLGVVQRSGLFNFSAYKEGYTGTPGKDDYAAYTEVQRNGSASVCRVEFSIADAKKAGLWGKSGPWQTTPKRMLKYRARSFALRDTFADVLKGLYTAEEMVDVEPVRDAFDPAAVRPAHDDGTRSLSDMATTAVAQLSPPAEPVKPRSPNEQKLRAAYGAVEDEAAADNALGVCGMEDLDHCEGVPAETINECIAALEAIRLQEVNDRAKSRGPKGAAGKQEKLV